MGEKLGFLYATVDGREQVIAGRVLSEDPVVWSIMLPGVDYEFLYSPDPTSPNYLNHITILGMVPGFEALARLEELRKRTESAEKIRMSEGQMSFENMAETLAIYTEENQVLRCNLAWLARQDGLSRTVLKDLSRRIKYHAEATADMRVAQDGREEDSAEYLRLQANVELACDMLDAVVASGLPELGDPTECDGQLPENWTARAANLVDVLRPCTKRQQSTTLHEIREYVR